MENVFDKAERLFTTCKDYVNIRIESAKLQASEKAADLLANMLAVMIVAMILLFCVCFAGLALSFYLGELTGKIWLGFLLVSVLFLIAGIIIWKARKRLIYFPVLNAVIKQFFKQHHGKD